MLIDKDLYYQISKENQVPHRCPILSRCLRRMSTLYFYNDTAIGTQRGELIADIARRQGWLADGVEIINIIGEEPGATKGDNSTSFENMCPEVSLFDNFYSPYFVQNYATTKASSVDGRDKIEECRHFIECAEYAVFVAENSNNSRTQKLPNNSPVELVDILTKKFNIDELKTLCMRLDIDDESLQGDTIESKARELVRYCKRREMTSDLIGKIKEARPKVKFTTIF